MMAWMPRFESAISGREQDRCLIRVQQAIRKTPKALVGRQVAWMSESCDWLSLAPLACLASTT
jgi:hypothetical protein